MTPSNSPASYRSLWCSGATASASTAVLTFALACALFLSNHAFGLDDKSDRGGIAAVCPVSCQNAGGGPFIPENEPCGVNTVNCGCDCAAQNFLQLRCPEGYCGSLWAFGGNHDRDWYNVHVNDSNSDGTEQVCVIVNSEMPVVVEIYTGNCGSLTLAAQGEANDCNPLTLCACLSAPSYAKLKIYPGTIAGGPINSGFPCPVIPRYTVRYNCFGVCNLGACCYQIPPVCAVMTQQQCSQLPSSTWFGVGSVCTANLCQGGPTGACCFINTQGLPQCTVTNQQNCEHNLFGIYMGNGTPCTAATCAQTGACCYVQPGLPGTQCIVVTQADCLAIYNGTYLGNNVPCTVTACAPQTGACCFLDAAGVMQCIQTDQQTCEHSYFGTFYGNGTLCTNIVCQPPTGACCYQNPLVAGFQCGIMSQSACIGLNGTYLGNGSVCNPDPCNVRGACCYQQPGTPWQCVEVSPQQCAALPNGVYWGNGTLCINVQCDPPPPKGACCYQIAGTTIYTCIVTTQQDCLDNYFNSIWIGANTTCNPDPCPPQTILGACCYRAPPPSTLHLCIVTTQQDCVNNYPGGIYQGNFTTCAQVVCDPPVNGACCWQHLPDPTVYCTITTQQDCHDNYPNSSWAGPNTTCNPNPCIPTGACCYLDPVGYHCIITTQSDCANYPFSNWLGTGSSCNPNPCEPKGACCFKDGPNAFWLCVVVTQQQCTQYPQSTWMGPNTTCNPSPCPRSGACCYQIPGTPGFQCIITTQADCIQNLNGTYKGDNVPCTPQTCLGCIAPPPNMVAWWTLDETSGGVANDSAGAHPGAYNPNVATGPTPLPGMVNGSLGFDGANDYVEVAHQPDINFNCGAFSIDAWVRPLSLGGGIVGKTGTFTVGYDFSVNTSGNLVLLMTTSSLRCIAVSTGTISPNAWTHVAVTVTGGGAGRTVTFYINGALSGTTGIGCVCVGNTAPLTIGSSFFNGLWRGKLDEIEIFNRVLLQTEIQDIMNKGKCKQHCGGQWESPYCINTSNVTATVQVCNDSAYPQMYFLNFSGIFTGPTTLCNGPLLTGFTVIGPNPVSVPPNTCLPVQVQIARPAGLTTTMHSCYNLQITNTATGQTTNCTGSVIRTNQWCWVLPDCCWTPIGVGTVAVFPFQVTNTGDPDQHIQYKFEVMGPNMGPNDAVRLNGLPPGTRYIGNLTLPIGQTTTISLNVEFTHHVPFEFYDLLVMGDENNSGDNNQVMLSRAIRSGPKPHVPCPADIAPPGGNLFVNVDDLLLVINSWGPCPQPCPPTCTADIAPPGGNCFVNVDDLLKVINSWGPCP